MQINFHKIFYNITSIKKAIFEYKDFAKFSISLKDDYIIVNITNFEKELEDKIKHEFTNYVLYLLNR